jgi:hypothetical protein
MLPGMDRRPPRLFTVEGAVLGVVTGLYITGTWGEVGFLRTVVIVLVVNTVGMLGVNRRLLRDNVGLHRTLSTIRAIPAVRCAGCHLHATKLVGPVGDEDDNTFMLPPGWGIRHDRPYCEDCLASGTVGW